MGFPKPDLVVAGSDWGGLGADPLALTLSVRFDDATWRTVAEYYQKRTTWPEIVHVLQTWVKLYHCERIWCDASQLQSVQALASMGLPAIATTIRDPEFRHRTLYSLAKTRRWRYNAKACPNLHNEFQLFGFSNTRSGIIKMQQRNDHALDATTYAICSEGETPEPIQRNELPPDERAPYYPDALGQMHFDSKAVIAHARKKEQLDEFAPTFDEMIEEDEDNDDAARQNWFMLTGTPYKSPE